MVCHPGPSYFTLITTALAKIILHHRVTLLYFRVRVSIMFHTVQGIPSAHSLGVSERRTTTITTFGNVQYLLDQVAAQVISFGPSRRFKDFLTSPKGELRPCTVIEWSKDHLDKHDLNVLRSDFAVQDDVWMPEFLEGEIYCCNEAAVDHCLQKYLRPVVILQAHQTSKMCVAQDGTHDFLEIEPTILPPGPYAIRPSTGEVFGVSRFYEDACNAFIGGSVAFSAQLRSFRWLMTGVRKSDFIEADWLTLIRTV